jgi:hypothetical protein
MPKRDTIPRLPCFEKIEEARKKLMELSDILMRVAHDIDEELAPEARLAWLYSLHDLADAEKIAPILIFVSDMTTRVDNWTDCMRPRDHATDAEAERFMDEIISPVRTASSAALRSVIDVCDSLREAFTPAT